MNGNASSSARARSCRPACWPARSRSRLRRARRRAGRRTALSMRWASSWILESDRRLEVGDDVGRAAVARDHRGVVAVVVARRRARRPARRAAAPRPGRPGARPRRCATSPARHERDTPGSIWRPVAASISVRRLDRLGRRVGGAVRAQPLRDPEPEHAGDADADHSDEQHAAAVACTNDRESLEHAYAPPFLSRRWPRRRITVSTRPVTTS